MTKQIRKFVKVGTFEPGMTVDGKTVEKWHVTDTTRHVSRPVCITFTDGTRIYVTELPY